MRVTASNRVQYEGTMRYGLVPVNGEGSTQKGRAADRAVQLALPLPLQCWWTVSGLVFSANETREFLEPAQGPEPINYLPLRSGSFKSLKKRLCISIPFFPKNICPMFSEKDGISAEAACCRAIGPICPDNHRTLASEAC